MTISDHSEHEEPFPLGKMFEQLQTEYHKLLSAIDGPKGYKVQIGNLCTQIRDLGGMPDPFRQGIIE